MNNEEYKSKAFEGGDNMAYNNRYQYETSPRKLQPEYEPRVKKYPKKSTVKKVRVASKKQAAPKAKKKLKVEAKVIVYVAIGFMILLAISYRNSVINERFAEIKTLKSNLGALQKENDQLEVNIESSLNLKTIEQSAKELLGMQKLENSQSIYVNLPKQDYIEPASEEIVTGEQVSIWERIINFITGK